MNPTATSQDYKVKDISLAEWGRKEIGIAEKEIIVLKNLIEKERNEHSQTKKELDSLKKSK